MSSTLYIVATPIGNLDDFSQRAIATLQQVDYVFAEDTRHSGRLLQHYAITTPMQAYHEFSDDAQIEKLFRLLEQGKNVALISDAGTPLISDPGYRLVKQAHEQNICVVPIPGACAAIAALSVAGLATDRFSFEGFLPQKSKARRDNLHALLTEPRTMVFYETPHRIVECLNDMLAVFGPDRPICLARELSKTFETIKLLPLGAMCEFVQADSNQQRGEFVLVLEGEKKQKAEQLGAEAERLAGLLKDELSPNTLSKIVAEYCAVPKKAVYEYILSLKN